MLGVLVRRRGTPSIRHLYHAVRPHSLWRMYVHAGVCVLTYATLCSVWGCVCGDRGACGCAGSTCYVRLRHGVSVRINLR